MDKVVHFEIPVEDMKRAEKFYNDVFGWKMNSVPSVGYTLISTVETGEKGMPKESGAINGGMLKRQGPIISPVITINVKNIDAAIKKLEKLGGKVVMPKFPVGNMGLSAYFKDTEGNVLGLWQNLK